MLLRFLSWLQFPCHFSAALFESSSVSFAIVAVPFQHFQIDPTKRHCTPGLRAYQWMMEVDRKARLFNQDRLHSLSLAHSNDVRLFCSHDALMLQAFANQSIGCQN